MRFCPTKNGSLPPPELSNPFELVKTHGVDAIMNLISFTSKSSVLKCWWANKPIECDTIMYDHFTDNGMCFTINPSINDNEMYTSRSITLYTQTNNIELMASRLKFTNLKVNHLFLGLFGNINYTGIKNNFLQSEVSGPKMGIKFLLNCEQSEYCTDFKDYEGAGFKGFIHDQTDVSVVQEMATLNFSPGYSYDVIIKPTVYQRRTEHLGKCLSQVKYAKNDLKGKYMNSACNLLCYFKYIWDKCNCLQSAMSSRQDIMAKILELSNITKLRICEGSEDLKSVSLATYYFHNSESQKVCTHCLPQCTQTMYSQSVTQKSFPSKTMMKFLKYLTTDQTVQNNLRKNYILVNIYFESKNMPIVVESQAYTLLDLLNNIGGGLGLFLGMSLVSTFEPLYGAFALLISFTFRKKKSKGGNNFTKKVIKINYESSRQFAGYDRVSLIMTRRDRSTKRSLANTKWIFGYSRQIGRERITVFNTKIFF